MTESGTKRNIRTAIAGEALPALTFVLGEEDLQRHLERHAYAGPPLESSPWGVFMPPSYGSHCYIPLLESVFESGDLIHTGAESEAVAPIPLATPLSVDGTIAGVEAGGGGRLRALLAWTLTAGKVVLARGTETFVTVDR